MKLKFLLPVVLSFYCFNSFAQDDLKSLQSNNGNSKQSMTGCNPIMVNLDYTVFPAADSVKVHSYFNDTIFVSGMDSVLFDGNWDVTTCGPIDHTIWYKENIIIDTVYNGGSFSHSYWTVLQPGNYHAKLIRIASGYWSEWTQHVVIINTNTTSINNLNNPDLNVSIIKNKIIVKDLLEKGNLLLFVYDLTGRSIFNKEIISPASSFEIEMPNLSNGLYVLNLKNKNFNFLKKFNSNNF